MIALLGTLLTIAGWQGPSTPPPPAEERESAPATGALQWGGSASEGLAAVARLSDSGKHAEALELARALLADVSDERVRAEVHYAAGLVQAESGAVEPALDDYARARALGGPGELRLDASYNSGVAVLEAAEVWRSQIPALGGTPAQGVPGVGGGAPGASGEQPPDPMQMARDLYLRARGILLERLRQEWRDADTRANLELIAKRLRELDELEQEQEEQEDQQESENQDEQQENSDESESDEQESDDPQESENEQEDPSDSEGEQPPEDKPAEEKEGEDEAEEEQQPQEQPEPNEDDPKDPHQPEPSDKEPEERFMTREEALRLLDRLAEIEEEGAKLQALLNQQRRRAVERDW